MKKLTIVRHAKSSWDVPDQPDFDRELNKRGQRDAPAMADRLLKRDLKPELIISSPAVRALRTARILAKGLDYPVKEIREERRIYDASPGKLVKLIQKLEDSVSDVMIVGHNPAFTYLCTYLTGDKLDNLPTCGIYRVEFRVDAWSGVDEKKGRCLFFDYPKKKSL